MQVQVVVGFLLIAVAVGQPSPQCPNPRPSVCVEDPCEKATCPRFTTPLTCCPELVNGNCTARWYQPNARRPINLGQCFKNINYCTPTRCRSNRICVEEVVPCSRPNCNFQAITAKCELPPQPMPVSSCDLVGVILQFILHNNGVARYWGRGIGGD